MAQSEGPEFKTQCHKKYFNRGFSGNEENVYPVPDPNKTMINELSDSHKKSLKEEIIETSLRSTWRSYKTQLTRKYKMHSRNFKTPGIKNLRRHRNN
jgi:hypothetical protein